MSTGRRPGGFEKLLVEVLCILFLGWLGKGHRTRR